MRLGAPVSIDTQDPEELARAHRARGLRAAYCPDVALADTDRIRAFREAYAQHDVVLAEVGVWNNLMDRDAAKRKANLAAMKEGLARAEAMGALCLVNIAGTMNPDHWDGPHPASLEQEAFDLAVANAREVIDDAKPKVTKFTYEMMPWAIPDSADSYAALIAAIDRPAFAVHLDIANIINGVPRYFHSGDVIRECFAKLGPHIVSCHLKDIALAPRLTTHLDEVRVGQGGLDLRAYLTEVSKLPHQPPVMLEHLPSAEEYDLARTYILGLAGETGLDFEK